MEIEYVDIYIDYKEYYILLERPKFIPVFHYPLQEYEVILENEIGRVRVGTKKYVRYLLSR